MPIRAVEDLGKSRGCSAQSRASQLVPDGQPVVPGTWGIVGHLRLRTRVP